MGIDPITHKPKYLSQSKEIADISHMAQWESARVQAEARLGRGSKFISSNPQFAAATAPPPLQPQPPCLDILKVWEWTHPLILNASNMQLSIPTVGLSSSFDNEMNIEGRGIMELDHLAMDHSNPNYVDQDCLGFPWFDRDHSNFATQGCWGVLEEIN